MREKANIKSKDGNALGQPLMVLEKCANYWKQALYTSLHGELSMAVATCLNSLVLLLQVHANFKVWTRATGLQLIVAVVVP